MTYRECVQGRTKAGLAAGQCAKRAFTANEIE